MPRARGIKAFRKYLVHTITRRAYTGRTGDGFAGEGHSSTVESYPARIEGKTTMVRDATGEERQSTRRVFVDTGQGEDAVIFDVRDLVTLPAEFWPATAAPPRLMDVQVQVGPDGVDHLELYL